MQFALLIYGAEDDAPGYRDETGYDTPAWKEIMARHDAYWAELEAAGAVRGGAGLRPVATARTMRVAADGERTVHDGPFAETREQLGGFYLIEASDMEAALAWARKLPLDTAASIEVRPCFEGEPPA